MTPIKLTIGNYVFSAHLEDEKAPKTLSAIKRYLPFSSSVIHVRWSGEGVDGDAESPVAKKQAGPTMELRPRTDGVVPKQG